MLIRSSPSLWSPSAEQMCWKPPGVWESDPLRRSPKDLLAHTRTYGMTWVGARDACASKNTIWTKIVKTLHKMKTKQNWRTIFLLNLCFGCFLTFQSVQTNAVLQIHAVFAFIILQKIKSVQKVQKKYKKLQKCTEKKLTEPKITNKWHHVKFFLEKGLPVDDFDQEVDVVVDDDHVTECNSWYR